MLRHKGVKRNFKHNLMLATSFAGVAGMVNVSGLILLHVFTTNITGHVGTLALSVDRGEIRDVFTVFTWIGCFLTGAFVASVLTRMLAVRNPRLSYVIPMALEIAALIAVDILYDPGAAYRMPLVCILLLFFAMGLQNSIVSVVSGNVVRTTHLTGMITDFGIGLGELATGDRTLSVRRKVVLTAAVVLSFLCGGIISGISTASVGRHILLFPAAVLFVVLCFDYLKLQYLVFTRKIKTGNIEH